MNRRRGPRLVAVVLPVALAVAAAATAQGPPPRLEIRRGDEVVLTRPEPPGAVRVLFVGNSPVSFEHVEDHRRSLVEERLTPATARTRGDAPAHA